MRIFFDCTHTAKHTYKNTGIHRVVRELKNELLKIGLNNLDIEIIPVMFDGNCIRRVTNLNQNAENKVKNISLLHILNNIIFKKIKNKIYTYFAVIKYLIVNLSSYFNKKSFSLNSFEGINISSGDIYIIADANWDLPKTYYKFLKNLKHEGVAIALICYDLIPLKFPEFCSQKFAILFTNFYQDYSVLFDKVMCISQNSLEDYQNAVYQGILSKSNPKAIIKKFRLGCDYSKSLSLLNDDEKSIDNYVSKFLKKKYILVVGSLVAHKNIQGIIEAFDLLINSQKYDINLLFAGNTGWDLKTDRLIESHNMYGESIHILGAVTDIELNFLYKNCYCLVQASFYEGFGLPVVEALQNYKPVIASTGGSLPEVGGDFCIYFDPKQPVQLYEALKKLLDSDSYYNQLVSRIRDEYKAFSWQESAEQFLAYLCS